MILSLHKWRSRGKFIVVFLVLTVIVYILFQLIAAWIQPVERYKQPAGKALKVFRYESVFGNSASVPDRLIFFYWYGE